MFDVGAFLLGRGKALTMDPTQLWKDGKNVVNFARGAAFDYDFDGTNDHARWGTRSVPVAKRTVQLPALNTPGPDAFAVPHTGKTKGLPDLKAPTAPGFGGKRPTSGWYTAMDAATQNRIADLAGGGPGAQRQLQDDYARKAADIKSRYRLAVTPEEKAQLQYELDVLNNQGKAATKAISTYYGQASKAAQAGHDQVLKDSPVWADALQSIYTKANAGLASGTVSAASEGGSDDTSGTGLVGLSVAGPDASATLADTGASDAAHAVADSKLAADDMSWLKATGVQEAAAQVGGVQNTVTNATASATADARKAWQARIDAEWQAQNSALDNLDSTYTGRSWSLNDARNAALADLAKTDYTARQDSNKDLWGQQNTYDTDKSQYQLSLGLDAYKKQQDAYATDVANRAYAASGGGLPTGMLETKIVNPGEKNEFKADSNQIVAQYNDIMRAAAMEPDLAKRQALIHSQLSQLPDGWQTVLGAYVPGGINAVYNPGR